ncbi:hypothetical protein K378_01383 [Streptomyces sp. Amel2xB2]|uniref:hypothetical protein n=1 Tax=Streptomyces sp. Amel2xB2 TaxID=1305829 RepID=UPI000DC0109C|nr:hypothetical protein [Streptomyces sp. Amel2xB2]RAJ70218.1 hypothetical protein K378_01383 [Streptomyces sp. Amel2xB2]
MDTQPDVCDVPAGDHADQVRLYAGGRLCGWHAPWAAAGRAAPHTVQAADAAQDCTTS